MYTQKVMDHFMNPRNMGELDDANGIGEVGNAKCGDIMRMYLKITDGKIEDVKFKTYGCASAIATSSIATEMIKGKTISEALTILPIFTPAAIPGLTVGCIIANIFSFNPVDMLVGTLGTLIAAILTRKTKHITFKGAPLLALFWPVIINAVLVGAELALLYFPADAVASAFAVSALQVGAGQFIVCYGLGLPLYFALRQKLLKV